MTCLMCRYFQPAEPEEHKQQRESGTCQQSCGRDWDHFTAIQYVRRHKQAVDGWCLLMPQPLVRRSAQVCGQISLLEVLTNPYWAITPFDRARDETLHEWASKQYQTLLYGLDGRRTEREHLEEQNKTLKQQLKAARKISASRLERLQKRDQKKPDQPEQQEPPKLPALRVVA
jgi:hypothetical protein